MHRFRSFLVALTVASSLAGGVGAGPALAVSSEPASALVAAPLAAATWSSWSSARVSTFAGSGGTATAGGTGTAAVLRAPGAVAAAAGVLWIAGADYIAKSTISSGATVVATGKPGETGCVDGAPAVARFGAARAAAVDGSYLYTLDQCGLRKTDLTTLATSTLSTPAGSLNGLTAPGDGYLYASYYSSVVRIDPASGAMSTFASLPGGCGGGRAGAIASDGTTLFVSIQEWNCSGYEAARRINTVKLSDASVSSLVVDGRIDTNGGLVALPGFLYTRIDLSTCTGMGCGTPTLRGPRLAQISTADGAVLALAGASAGFADGTGTAAWFAGISSIATDGASLFVADPANNRVRKAVASPAPARAQSSWVSAAAPMFFASVRTVAGGSSATSRAGTGTSAGFNAPTGITVGTVSGKTYAWVGTKDAIMKVDLATGATTVAAGKPGEPGHVDAASGATSRVASATELVTDGQDVFFLSEGLLARMAIATGAVSTFGSMGAPSTSYTKLAGGPDGYLYAMASGGAIYKVDPIDGRRTLFGSISQPSCGGAAAYDFAVDKEAVWVLVADLNCGGYPGRPYLQEFALRSAAYMGAIPIHADGRGMNWANDGVSLASVGDQLFVAYGGWNAFSQAANMCWPTEVFVVDKLSGMSGQVAGPPQNLSYNSQTQGCAFSDVDNEDGMLAWFSTINAMASDGTNLYVTGTTPDNNRVRVLRPLDPSFYGIEDPLVGAGGGSPDANSPQCACADPVDLNSGEFWDHVTDLALPGRLAVEASRTYSTLRRADTGVFGRGWSSFWDTRVIPGSPTLVVHENGSQTRFSRLADGTFAVAPDTVSTLTRSAGGEYTYTLRDDVRYVFDTTGRLKSVYDRNGENVSVTWSSTSVVLRAADGRTLTGTLDPSGRITKLDGPEARSVLYHYDANGRLDDVTDARGGHWTYTYDVDGRLTSKTSPAGDATTNHYDSAGRVDRQTSPRGGVSTFGYQATGQAMTTRVTDPTGVVTDYSYDRGLMISRTVDPAGEAPSAWHYRYDVYGNLVESVSPTGVRTGATYDSRADALTTTDGAGKVTAHTYNAFHEPLTATDPGGVVTTWTYDAAGNLTSFSRPRAGKPATTTYVHDPTHPADILSTTDPDGRTTVLSYTPEGFLAASRGLDGATATWGRDAYGMPTALTTPRGNAQGATASAFTTTYGYDAAGNLLTVASPLGTTSITYDPDGRTTKVVDASGATALATFGPGGDPLTTTDALGRVTKHAYDASGRPTATTSPGGAQTTWSYDTHGRLASTTRPIGNSAGASASDRAARTTTVVYDAADHVVSTATPDPDHAGQYLTTTITYDSAGRVAANGDALGRVTKYVYDTTYVDRLAKVTDPAGASTTFGYDEWGSLTKTTDPLGRATSSTLSPGGLVTAVTDPLGYVTQYTRDPAGRVATTVDPRGTCSGCTAANYTTTYAYDLDGNGVSITDPLGHVTTTAFTATGLPSSTTDAQGRVVGYGYDSLGRLTTVTDPTGAVTTNGYDAAGQLVSRTDPLGHTATATYDADGRIASATDALGRTQSYEYDLDGNLTSHVTARGNAGAGASGTVASEYDSLDRPVRVEPGDGSQVVSLGYDAASQLVSRTDASGSMTRTYDLDGRPLSQVQGGQTWGFTWAADGTLTTRTRPDGLSEAFTYDKDRRITKVVDPTGSTTFGYDRAGNLTSATNPNGTTQTQTYDRAGYLASVATKAGSATRTSQTIARDATNRPTQVTVLRNGSSQTRSYKYDAVGQLQGVCYTSLAQCTGASAATQWWTYDAVGNRTSEKNGTGAGTTTTYTYDAADQLTSSKAGADPAVARTYDPDGNLLADGTTSWTYDLFNRAATATVGGATTAYTRDALGNITKSTGASTTTDLLWDPIGAVPTLSSTTTANQVTDYLYDPRGRVRALTGPAGSYTTASDPVGAPTDLLSSAGAITRSSDWTPFGTPRAPIGAPAATGPASAVSFGGLVDVDDTASLAARDRMYDPSTGMWAGADPLPAGAARPAVSTYQYAFGVPGQFVDPTGDWPSCSFTECLGDIGHMAWGEVLGAGDMIKGLAVWASPVGRWNDFKAGLACAGAWKTYGFDPLAVAATCQNLNPMNGIVQGFRDTYTFAMKGCYEASGRAFFPAMAQSVMVADGAAAGLRGSGSGVAGASIEDAITVDAEAAGSAEAAGQSGTTARAARAVDDVDALPCNCFVAGTQVRAAGGQVPIEDLKVGDRVWAKNLETGADELRTITGLFSKQAETLMTITVADGASVVVTEEHPFYVVGVGWVMSGDLRVGDRLAQRDGGSTAITWISTRSANSTVYNFTVEGDHDYYVTDAQLLVHNCPTQGAGSFSSRGSKGRTTPGGANEARAMQLVKDYPEYGDVLSTDMADSRWPASEGWVKMRQYIDGVEIHYNFNAETGVYDDFKFKDWRD